MCVNGTRDAGSILTCFSFGSRLTLADVFVANENTGWSMACDKMYVMTEI